MPRSGRPRITSDRDYRALQRLVRRMTFATSAVLKQHWLPNGRLSTRTVRNRLKSAGLKLHLCVSKPSSDRRLHEAETGSRLTNGSCAMSLNSNHVGLNTMPNVIVDVGLITIQGNLTGDQYIRDIIQPVVVPHFDNHSLATKPVYMYDNTKPHRSKAVTTYLPREAMTFSLSKRHLLITRRHLLFKDQYRV
jgi:hypothetical protein